MSLKFQPPRTDTRTMTTNRPAAQLQPGHTVQVQIENVDHNDDGTVTVWLTTGGNFTVAANVWFTIAARPSPLRPVMVA